MRARSQEEPSSRDGRVGNVERLVNNRQSLAELFFANTQRRIHKKSVPTNEGEKPVLSKKRAELSHKSHLGGRRIKGGQRLARLAVFDQFEQAKQADGAGFSNRGMLIP